MRRENSQVDKSKTQLNQGQPHYNSLYWRDLQFGSASLEHLSLEPRFYLLFLMGTFESNGAH